MTPSGPRSTLGHRAEGGFILLPVALLLGLIATVAFMGNHETALSSAMSNATNSADKARLAAEAGLQRAIVQMHSKGCSGMYPIPILGPVKDTAFDGATYSASAWPLSGSPVDITSVGTYGDATVTLTRSNVPMHQSSTVTMTLQPAVEGLDTQVTSGSSSNNGNLTTMALSSGSSHGLLQFDLSTIPAGSHVTSATLSTYATAGNNNGTVSLYRVLRDWTEAATWSASDGSTAWSQTGGDVNTTAVASAAFSGAGTWLAWNVTALADRWLKGSIPNQGVQIRVDSAGISGLQLSSSDSAIAAQRPKLDVTFLPPCGWTPPSTTVTLNPRADADIDSGLNALFNYGAQPNLYLSQGSGIHPLLSFDVSGISPGKVVQSATLRMYFGALAPGNKLSKTLSLNVYSVSYPWKELEATWMQRQVGNLWLTAGGDYGSTVIATKSMAQNSVPGQWIEFTVTSQVQSWIDGVSINNGFLLTIPTSSNESLIFNSREAASNPPELIVTYK